jgi:hypothetical protein
MQLREDFALDPTLVRVDNLARLLESTAFRMGELTLAWESAGRDGLPLAAKPRWIASDQGRLSFS